MLNVVGKCVVSGEAMQSFVHRQHDGVGKIKYRKELRSLYAKFVYHNGFVREYYMSRRRDREPSRTPVKKLKRLSQKRKGFLTSLHCHQNFMVTSVGGAEKSN